jgi:NitT/TauT family transport system substrate-binding protein
MTRGRGAFILAALAALLLTGCRSAFAPPRLRLAIVDWPAYEYFYLASRRNLDRQQGLTLQVDQFGSLQDQRQAYSRGDVDAIATTLPEAIAICHQAPQRCPAIVLVLDQSNGADQLIGQAEFAAPPNLKGRRVGLERSVLGEFMLVRALGDSGLTLADLKLRYSSPKALVAQLQAGQLEAIVSYTPHSDRLLRDPRWRVLFSSSQIPGEVVDVLAVDPELVRQNPGQVRSLVNTWWAARRLAAAEPEQAVAVMAQRQGVTPQQFIASQALISYPDRADQPALLAASGPVQRTLEMLSRQMRLARRLPAGVPLPRLMPELER